MRQRRPPIALVDGRFVQAADNDPRKPASVDGPMLAELRRILHSTRRAAILADRLGHIVVANPAAAELFRCEEMESKRVEDFVPEPARHAHRVYRRVYNSIPANRPMARQAGLKALCSDGRVLLVQIELTPFWTLDDVWTVAVIRKIPGQE